MVLALLNDYGAAVRPQVQIRYGAGGCGTGKCAGQGVQQQLLALLPVEVLPHGLNNYAVHTAIKVVCGDFNLGAQTIGKPNDEFVGIT